MIVGYKLTDEKGNVIQRWGGVWGARADLPDKLVLPNGDQVCGAQPGETYGQHYRLDPWMMEEPAPTKEDVKKERDSRTDSGILFKKSYFQTRPEDRENIAGAVIWAVIAVMNGARPGDYRWHGGKEDFVWIATDNSLVPMDAYELIEFGKTAAAWKSAHIFAARQIKDLPEIPADFGNDKNWPQQELVKNETPVV